MMQRSIFILLGLFPLCFLAIAQSFVLKNQATHQIITNDTLLIQSKDNGGWVGAESLDLGIVIKNTTNKTREVGAKKIEFEVLQKNVQHTICFAGQCYDVSTFDSPFHISLAPGDADSSFLAHYLFNNTVHIRGSNHVAYVFYDVANPKDSSIVHVIYNTIVSAKLPTLNPNRCLKVFPNPCQDYIFLGTPELGSNNLFALKDIWGRILMEGIINTDTPRLDLGQLPKGMYQLSISGKNSISIKFLKQ